MVRVFPTPTVEILAVLADLDDAARLDAADGARLTSLGDRQPRPWEPATCPPELRIAIWQWCDEVAIWINHDYGWRSTHTIPPCWPRHPYLAHELPLLVCQRWAAGRSHTRHLLEDWHERCLPGFLARMNDHLEGTSCRTGRHTDWPAAAAHAHYIDGAEQHTRDLALFDDLDAAEASASH